VNRKRAQIFWVFVALAVGCAAFLMWARHMAYSETPYNPNKVQLMSLELAIRAFNLDTHSLPHTLQDLVVPGDFNNWHGPYAKERNLLNVFGQPFGYEPIDSAKPKFRLFTSGPNGASPISETYEP
jgi:hypothetical protein